MFDAARHRFTQLVLSATFVLIAAGGLVTSTGSGLSVPDWPLSYGRFFPPMVGGILYEHSHRVIAGGVGLLTFAMTLWYLATERRAWVRRLALLAFAAVAAQAVLGGLTVIYLLPLPVSVSHACLGQTFFALLGLLALFTSREWVDRSSPAPLEGAAALTRLFGITLALAYLQLVLGALVRHADGAGIYVHMTVGFLVALHALLLVLRVSRLPATVHAFQGPVLLLSALILGQIFLGFGAFALKVHLAPAAPPRSAEVLLATAHQANGALVLALLAVQTARSCRLFAPR